MRVCRSLWLIVICVISLGFSNGCGPSAPSAPSAEQQAAVDERFGRMNDPKATTIISFEQKGEWGHAIIADGPEPQRAVGQAFLTQVTLPDETKKWMVMSYHLLVLRGNEVVGDIIERSEVHPEAAVGKKWEAKWQQYIERKGYQFPKKAQPSVSP